jgi:hypothetical protein
MGIKGPPLSWVWDKHGKIIPTFSPSTVETVREVTAQFLPRHLIINPGPTDEEREIANSFDVKKALEKARVSRKSAGLT